MKRQQPLESLECPHFVLMDIRSAQDVELAITSAINEQEKVGTFQQANRLRRLLTMLRQESA
jgi:hypothetical protein